MHLKVKNMKFIILDVHGIYKTSNVSTWDEFNKEISMFERISGAKAGNLLFIYNDYVLNYKTICSRAYMIFERISTYSH